MEDGEGMGSVEVRSVAWTSRAFFFGVLLALLVTGAACGSSKETGGTDGQSGDAGGPNPESGRDAGNTSSGDLGSPAVSVQGGAAPSAGGQGHNGGVIHLVAQGDISFDPTMAPSTIAPPT